MVQWLQNTMVNNGTISQEDMNYFTVTDDPAVALSIVREASTLFGVTPEALSQFRLSQR
jgi:predicted Rossmann-fold nucleotide-binding protein